jgi:hypothetical protein
MRANQLVRLLQAQAKSRGYLPLTDSDRRRESAREGAPRTHLQTTVSRSNFAQASRNYR